MTAEALSNFFKENGRNWMDCGELLESAFHVVHGQLVKSLISNINEMMYGNIALQEIFFETDPDKPKLIKEGRQRNLGYKFSSLDKPIFPEGYRKSERMKNISGYVRKSLYFQPSVWAKDVTRDSKHYVGELEFCCLMILLTIYNLHTKACHNQLNDL